MKRIQSSRCGVGRPGCPVFLALCLLLFSPPLLAQAPGARAQPPTQQEESNFAPWLMLRGNGAGTGASPESVPPPLREFMRTVSPHKFTGIVADEGVAYFGSSDHSVYAYQLPEVPPFELLLKAATPELTEYVMNSLKPWKRLWAFPTNGDVEATPAVADGVVFAPSTDHHLYAIDAQSGKLRWRLRLRGNAGAPPVVASGVVYLGADDHTLRAVEAATGRALWERELGGDIRAAACVMEDAVFVGCADHRVYALNSRDGAERWESDVGDDVMTPLAVSGGVVYGTNLWGKLFALDAATGKRVWEYQERVVGEAAPAVVGGKVIVLRRKDLRPVALDAQTGRARWESNLPAVSAPVIGGEYLYLSRGIAGEILALSHITGKVVSIADFGSRIADLNGSMRNPQSAGNPFADLAGGALRGKDSPATPQSAPPPAALRNTPVHIAVHRNLVLAAMPHTLSVFMPFPQLPSDGSPPIPLLSPRSSPGHPVAVADVYVGPPQRLEQRAQFPPNKTLRATDRTLMTLDAQRSFDLLRHHMTFRWVEDLGAAPMVRRAFGVGDHLVFLVVTDEEGASSDPASIAFQVVPPLNDIALLNLLQLLLRR